MRLSNCLPRAFAILPSSWRFGSFFTVMRDTLPTIAHRRTFPADATLPEYLAHGDKVAIAGAGSSEDQEEAERGDDAAGLPKSLSRHARYLQMYSRQKT